jgi:hypothetical protein
VLDQQHLAAQGADDLAALVAHRKHLLQHGGAADHGRGDLMARALVEQDAVDQRRLLTRHRPADAHGQRVRTGHRDRLRLRHDDDVVVGTREEHRVGVRQVGQ